MPIKPKPTPPAKSSSRSAKVKAASPMVDAARPSTSQAMQTASVASTQRLTPLQRLQQIVAKQPQGNSSLSVVSCVEELQELLKTDKANEKIAMKMKLLWASDYTYQQWSLTRLHFTDAAAPGLLHDQVQVFQQQYDANPDAVNAVLLTATMWDLVSTSEDLPPPGSIVRINNYSSLKLFRDEQCQVTVKLRDLTWSSDAEHASKSS